MKGMSHAESDLGWNTEEGGNLIFLDSAHASRANVEVTKTVAVQKKANSRELRMSHQGMTHI